MERGVRLAVDVGRARVGIARSDPDGLMAVPVETIPRDNALARFSELVSEYQPLVVVVGLPVNLHNNETESTRDSREFARQLASSHDVSVVLVDERLTTTAALGALRASGRSAKNSRGVVDQVAAVMLLETYLDSEKGGRPLGERVEAAHDNNA